MTAFQASRTDSLYLDQYFNTFWFLIDKFLSLSGGAWVPKVSIATTPMWLAGTWIGKMGNSIVNVIVKPKAETNHITPPTTHNLLLVSKERYGKNKTFLLRFYGIDFVPINPITDGGGVQHPTYQKSALRPSKWPPNDPKFRDFSYFYMTYMKSKQNFFWFFTVILGVYNVYFQPRPK